MLAASSGCPADMLPHANNAPSLPAHARQRVSTQAGTPSHHHQGDGSAGGFGSIHCSRKLLLHHLHAVNSRGTTAAAIRHIILSAWKLSAKLTCGLSNRVGGRAMTGVQLHSLCCPSEDTQRESPGPQCWGCNKACRKMERVSPILTPCALPPPYLPCLLQPLGVECL